MINSCRQNNLCRALALSQIPELKAENAAYYARNGVY